MPKTQHSESSPKMHRRPRGNGPEMVAITRAEYSRLRAAAAKLRALQPYTRGAADDDEADQIPGEYIERLLDGENPLRVYRDLRGLSREELASASGLSPEEIGDIEMGRSPGSLPSLEKLAEALRVSLEEFVPPEDP